MNPANGNPIRVVIVDDETMLSMTLEAWLRRDPDLCVEGIAASGNLGWELCVAKRPDVALVDVEMPDGDGLTLAKRLQAELPEIRVILMTGRVDPHTAWRASKAGVQGIIDKTMEPGSLNKIIHLVMNEGRFLSPAFAKIREDWLVKPDAFQKVLTNREMSVLYRLPEGKSDLEIGKEMGITEATVECHRKSLRKKLDLHDDRSLVAYARKRGIFGAGG